MSLDGRRRYGAIEFERHDNHEKTIQLYPGTVRVREAFVLRSIEVYPWFNDLVTASAFRLRLSGLCLLPSAAARGVFGWRAQQLCLLLLLASSARVPRRDFFFSLRRRC